MSTFKKFNQDISWNTKFYVLLAAIMVVFAFLSEGNDYSLIVGSIIALLVVWIIDYYVIVSRRYPKIWRIIKIAVISTLVILIILGNSK